jgi:hypothetical protein
MEAVSTIFTQIRTLVQPLSAEQRLQLIQDIASMTQDNAVVRETPSRAEQLALEDAYWYGLPVEMRALRQPLCGDQEQASRRSRRGSAGACFI